MVAYEFDTQLTENGTVSIPAEYQQNLPKGTTLRVILLVEEPQTIADSESSQLAKLVANIQQMPLNPANITRASGLLGAHLRELANDPVQEFDTEVWMADWGKREAEMKANSLAHEALELQKLAE